MQHCPLPDVRTVALGAGLPGCKSSPFLSSSAKPWAPLQWGGAHTVHLAPLRPPSPCPPSPPALTPASPRLQPRARLSVPNHGQLVQALVLDDPLWESASCRLAWDPLVTSSGPQHWQQGFQNTTSHSLTPLPSRGRAALPSRFRVGWICDSLLKNARWQEGQCATPETGS